MTCLFYDMHKLGVEKNVSALQHIPVVTGLLHSFKVKWLEQKPLLGLEQGEKRSFVDFWGEETRLFGLSLCMPD